MTVQHRDKEAEGTSLEEESDNHRNAAQTAGEQMFRSMAAEAQEQPLTLTRRSALQLIARSAALASGCAGLVSRANAGQRQQRPGRNGQGKNGRGGANTNPLNAAAGAATPPANLGSLVKAFMTKTSTPGVAVVIYQAGKENIYCWGNARTTPSPVQVTPDTVFGIGSVTKVFTSTLLACRVGASSGGYTLNDPVLKHLPAAVQSQHKDIAKVTLKMLATHTADFPDSGVSGAELFEDKAPSSALLSWWENWTDSKSSSLGTRYAYSNVGMITLGYAVAGNNYNTMLQRSICRPLGMAHTAPASFLPGGCPLAQGHVAQGSGLVAINTQNSDLNSSSQDMLLYLKAQMGAMRVPPALSAAITLTHQPQFTPPSGAQTPIMGLGWQISQGATKVYTKDGGTSDGGCCCWIGHCPDKSSGVVVMINSFGTGKTSGQSVISLGSSLFKAAFGITV